jgi:hypothetical protein
VPLRKQHPVRFAPKGLSDAYDSTEAFDGACRSLQNLVFDPSNPEVVVCRPGVGSPLTSFGSFTNPTFVTVHISIGGTIFGMVSTSRFTGHDEPFCYNITTGPYGAAGTFTTITGSLLANTPTSPPTSGAWTPPVMTVVGTKIVVAHSGFSGAGTNFFGIIDISTPATPTWSTSKLATNALPSVPTVVANLNNRAYFACGNILYFSDVLDPLTRTNASQSLTIGDPSSVIALSGLPVQTTSAGVVAALLAFKEFQIWQITGDLAATTLALNFLSLNVGTKAPRSVTQTPYGTNFMAIDGPYIVDPLGTVKPLTKQPGAFEQDIQSPFIYATQPSRVAGGYSGGTYRIFVDTAINGVASSGDYWFDIQRRRWNGPHTWPVDCASQIGNYFVVSHASKGAALYRSQLNQDATSVYTDNNVAISFYLQSSTFPKDGTMTQKMVVESTIETTAVSSTAYYQVSALDDSGTVMSTNGVVGNQITGTWGLFNWGVGYWGTASNAVTVRTIHWNQPLVFQKMALVVSGNCSINIAIGSFFARYQDAGYTNFDLSG